MAICAGVGGFIGDKALETKTGKDVVKKTVELTINNQKEMIKTSGEALKEVGKSLREQQEKTKASMNGKAKKTSKKAKQKEVTIDDLID